VLTYRSRIQIRPPISTDGAFIETFGRRETSGVTPGWNVVTLRVLAARDRTQVTASRLLRLVDLTGSGLAQIGADSRLASGSYDVSQRWALSFFQHPSEPDGMFYRTRHDPSRFAAAIFDRAASVLRTVSLGSLADPDRASLLSDILLTYGYDVTR
jgi:hypothetical protein